MARLVKLLVPVCAVAALALMAGFYMFANSVKNLEPRGLVRADGIVVLTGGDDRIAAGLELIAAGKGRRLLITGVDPRHRTPAELSRRLGSNEHIFKCCIDLGHAATNTFGNAEEARRWVEAWGHRSVLIVTSSFHMPRSLAEFSRAMPEVKLIAYPVPSRYLRVETWWRSQATVRMLAGEYLKFLASAARLGLARVTGAWEQPTIADQRAARPQPI